jgi:hypothetical protein
MIEHVLSRPVGLFHLEGEKGGKAERRPPQTPFSCRFLAWLKASLHLANKCGSRQRPNRRFERPNS